MRGAIVRGTLAVADQMQQRGLKLRRRLGNLIQEKRATRGTRYILREHRGNSRIGARRVLG